MNALVLSAGGMYGAYQAGAWRALADVFRPDLVVGASIGAVTGWAIAGGCHPDELIARWLNLEPARRYRWKFPRSLLQGVLDTGPLEQVIRNVYESYQPRVDFALVLTDLLRLRPRILRGQEVHWRHLAASVAIVGLFDQVRIDGRVYSDGGLLGAVPLWVAAELGATKALVIDALPKPPGAMVSALVSLVRLLSPFRPPASESLKVMRVAPPGLLGSPLEALCWSRRNAERWIQAGEQQAGAIKHSIANCFERE